MPELQLPDGCCELFDVIDTDGTWEELAVRQQGEKSRIDRSTFKEGDCYAFTNSPNEGEACNRPVFVLMVDDQHALVFDMHGSRIDEPENNIVDGRHDLDGEFGFFAEWEEGNYTVPSREPPPNLLSLFLSLSLLLRPPPLIS